MKRLIRNLLAIIFTPLLLGVIAHWMFVRPPQRSPRNHVNN